MLKARLLAVHLDEAFRLFDFGQAVERGWSADALLCLGKGSVHDLGRIRPHRRKKVLRRARADDPHPRKLRNEGRYVSGMIIVCVSDDQRVNRSTGDDILDVERSPDPMDACPHPRGSGGLRPRQGWPIHRSRLLRRSG